jgi:hypothetical protein
LNSYANIFPTGAVSYDKIPESEAPRFGFIDKEKD